MSEFSINRNGDTVAIDLGNPEGPELQELVSALKHEIASGARTLTIDLSGNKSLGCRGIGLLVAAGNSILLAQGVMNLTNVPQNIMQVLQTLRLTERLKATANGKAAFDGRK